MKKIQGILLLLVFVCVATALLSSAFTGERNIENLLRRTSLFGILGIGVAFVIITGGIDLSIGSVIGLTGCLLAIFLIELELSIWFSLGLVMGLALLIGLAHGLLITKLGLQPFVVTLCGLLIYRGLARWITNDQTKGFGSVYEDSLRLLAIGYPCSFALLLTITGIGAAVWAAWRWWRHRDDEYLGRDVIGFIGLGGLALMLIGASRYAHGYSIETGGLLYSLLGFDIHSWRVLVPEAGAELPQIWMRRVGWLWAPAAIWFLVVVFLSDWRRIAAPALAMLGGIGLLALALYANDSPDANSRFRMLAVFLALAAFLGALAWLGRSGMRAAGRPARLPLIVFSSTSILWLAGQTALGKALLPAPFFALAVLAIAAAIFLNRTIFGRYLLALGRNEEAARYSGINTQRLVVVAYVISAATSGIGGILMSLDTNSVQPASYGNFYELYAIAAAVLGGCSLRGGEGSILGVVIGTAVMHVLYNSILLLRIPTELEFAIIGIVILIGVIVDELMKRWTARRRAREAQ